MSGTKMAGVPGFEPGNAGIKIRCLTTWLHPSRWPSLPIARDGTGPTREKGAYSDRLA